MCSVCQGRTHEILPPIRVTGRIHQSTIVPAVSGYLPGTRYTPISECPSIIVLAVSGLCSVSSNTFLVPWLFEEFPFVSLVRFPCCSSPRPCRYDSFVAPVFRTSSSFLPSFFLYSFLVISSPSFRLPSFSFPASLSLSPFPPFFFTYLLSFPLRSLPSPFLLSCSTSLPSSSPLPSLLFS